MNEINHHYWLGDFLFLRELFILIVIVIIFKQLIIDK